MEMDDCCYKIMIVDDEKTTRTYLRGVVEQSGMSVVCEAEDGNEVLALIDRHNPDLILMDYMMKDINGVDAIREIVKYNKNVKVIMLTQAASPSLVMSSIKVGASNFLMKSCSREQLVTVIKKVLE